MKKNIQFLYKLNLSKSFRLYKCEKIEDKNGNKISTLLNKTSLQIARGDNHPSIFAEKDPNPLGNRLRSFSFGDGTRTSRTYISADRRIRETLTSHCSRARVERGEFARNAMPRENAERVKIICALDIASQHNWPESSAVTNYGPGI